MPTIRIRNGGRVTLPAEFRKLHNIKEGDKYEVTDMGNRMLYFRLIRQSQTSQPALKKQPKSSSQKP